MANRPVLSATASNNSNKKWHLAAALVLLKLAVTAALICGFGSKAMAFSESEFEHAFQQFNAASGAEENAAQSFAALLKKEPNHPLLMSYTGAATTKLATTTFFPWKKMSYAEQGLAQLDKALQLAALPTQADGGQLHHGTPLALEVKLVAANTFLAVPAFMNRASRGASLLAEVLASPQFDGAALAFRGAVWLRAAALALAQQRTDDARRYLTALIRAGAPQAESAKAMLATLKGGA